MKLDSTHYEQINQLLAKARIKNEDLHEELIDHLCCAAEDNFSEDIPFSEFITQKVHEMAPLGLRQLEIETNYALYSKSFIIMKKITYIIGLLSSIILATGVLFKLMQWPYATILLVIGISLLLLVFVPYTAYEKLKAGTVKNGIDKARIITGVISSVIVAISILFKVLHLMGANIVFVLGMALFILAFLPLQFIQLYKSNSPKSQPTK